MCNHKDCLNKIIKLCLLFVIFMKGLYTTYSRVGFCLLMSVIQKRGNTILAAIDTYASIDLLLHRSTAGKIASARQATTPIHALPRT